MRLTLRTLLAYLDDTLEPAQARLIGQKVAESDGAQELIARIRQVARRRRLTTPSATGEGAKLDANTMAEYLDNVLPPEQLAETEKTCLASDVHLAEVAACHQILTLVLGEPVLVPPTARQRMYRLIRGRESVPGRKAPDKAIGQGMVASAKIEADEADNALLLGLPMHRSGARTRWLIPVAAATLLLVAGVAIWMALFSDSASPRPRPLPLAQLPAPPVPDIPEKTAPAPAPEAPKEPVSVVQPEPVKAGPEEKAKEPVAKTPPAAEPPPVVPMPPVETKPPPSTVTKTVPAPGVSKILKEVGKLNLVPGQTSVLVQRSEKDGTWNRVRPESRVTSVDPLISLPGYRSELRMDRGIRLILWGNVPELSAIAVRESAVVLHENPAVDLDLTLKRGRIVLANLKDEGPVNVRLRFQKEVWELQLLDRTSEAAVELIQTCAPFAKENQEPPDTSVLLSFFKGQARIKIHGEEQLVERPSALYWHSLMPESSPAPPLETLKSLPNWFVGTGTKDASGQGIQSALESLSKRLAARGRLNIVLAETLNDPNEDVVLLTLRCLGAIGDFSKVLDALANEQVRPKVRVTAAEVLRHMLGEGLEADEAFRKAARQKQYTEEQITTMLQLLHHLNEQDLSNLTVRSGLADYLNHDKLAIRELAYGTLVNLVPEGRKIPYDPTSDAGLRERAVQSWRNLILNPPKPAPPK